MAAVTVTFHPDGGIPPGATKWAAFVQENISTAVAVKAAVVGKTHYIVRALFTGGNAQSVWLQDNTGTPVKLTPQFKMQGTSFYWTFDFKPIWPISVGSGKQLSVMASSTDAANGVYVEGFTI